MYVPAKHVMSVVKPKAGMSAPASKGANSCCYIQTSWRLEQVQQCFMESKLHCKTMEKTLIKCKLEMDQAQENLRALQG